jgi:hypothetical protein
MWKQLLEEIWTNHQGGLDGFDNTIRRVHVAFFHLLVRMQGIS